MKFMKQQKSLAKRRKKTETRVWDELENAMPAFKKRWSKQRRVQDKKEAQID